MTYPGDPEIARSLGGGPNDTELPSGGITAAMEYGKSQILLFTNKDDWNTNDPAAGSIAKAREYFASSWIRDNWKDKEKKAKEHYERAVSILKNILKNPGISSTTPPDTEHVSTAYSYMTPNLNDSIPYYKSPRTEV